MFYIVKPTNKLIKIQSKEQTNESVVPYRACCPRDHIKSNTLVLDARTQYMSQVDLQSPSFFISFMLMHSYCCEQGVPFRGLIDGRSLIVLGRSLNLGCHYYLELTSSQSSGLQCSEGPPL